MAIRRTLDVNQELLDAFDHAFRVTETLAAAIPPRFWPADPPGGGRTIAQIFAHMQSLRRTFAKMGGAPAIAPLDRARLTPANVRRALRHSRTALAALFREAIGQGRGRVPGMPRRTVDMMAYLIQHEAHHRGQITLLARALGHRLAGQDQTRLWGWRKL